MKILLLIALFFILATGLLVYFIKNPVFARRDEARAATEVDRDSLHAHVFALTHTAKPRNAANIDALNEAAAYIHRKLSEYGYTPDEQKYRADGREYKNIIASYGPADAQRIIVGAHYDVAGEQPGADDNASGVAGLLELARLCSVLKPRLEYRIDFVAFSLEEPPYFRSEYMGSAVHARSLHEAGIPVRAMICLEMIGYFSDAAASQSYPLPALRAIYPDKGNFIAVVGSTTQKKIVADIKKAMIEGSDIPVESINAPPSVPGLDFSDHQNYWRYDYQAVMITNTSFYRNKNYHTAGDTIETLDFRRMGEVVKGIWNAILSLE